MAATARLARIGLAALTAFGALTSFGISRASATPPGDPGLIAIGCEAGLWTVEPDGENLVQVTDAETLTPDWSPGGTMLAFTRDHGDGLTAVWIMDGDGTDERRLINPNGSALDPSWRPDATSVTYSWDAVDDGKHRQIRQISPDSNSISSAQIYSHFDLHDPAIHPDNHSALVVGTTVGPQTVWLNTVTAYQVYPVVTTPAGASDGSPDWSPMGEELAFVRNDGATRSIWAVQLSGGSFFERLTDETVDAISPTYAADGSRIAYLSRPVGTDAPFELWTMDADGGNKALVLDEVACDHIDWQPIPTFPLVDARFSSFNPAIRWAFQEGIATGCAPERFCHQRFVSRGQVATFLARALELPDATVDHYDDDDGTTHEDDINRLADAGLTTGCAPSSYCPTFAVTRGQMASLMARALELPEASLDYFDDDDGRTHEANINRMAEAELTSGCEFRKYCPERMLTRGEAMALIYRALAP